MKAGTPLHFSYAKGQTVMSRYLLDNGANYEARNKLGQVPADILLLKKNHQNSPFALVELFTSESCSSCPPAERLTSEIRRMAFGQWLRIYCVSFHVDYFDGGTWRTVTAMPATLLGNARTSLRSQRPVLHAADDRER